MSGRFRQKLRFFPLVALIFASLSGGPFGIESMLPTTGPGMTLLLLVLAALLWCVPMILTSAELGSAIPVEGGYYRWTRRALGDFWGFQAGWWVWLSSLLDQAIYPVLMVSFLEKFMWPGIRGHALQLGALRVEWLSWILCMCVIVPCTVINIRGVRSVGLSSIILDTLVLAPYAIFIVVALVQWKHNPFTPLVPPGRGVITTLGYGLLLSIWNYSGYELPSTVSEEVENASVALPRALFTALPLVMLSYILPVAAGLASYGGWSGWQEGTFVDIARHIGEIVPGGGPVLGFLVTLATVAGCASLFNGLLVPYTRLQFAMAEDRFLPAALARLHHRYSTPALSILFNCAIYSILVMLPFQELLTVDLWLLLPAYPLVYISLLVIRKREPHMHRPFMIRGGAWGLALVTVPPCTLAFFALYSSGLELVSLANHKVLWFGVACIASGPAAYAIGALWHRLRGTRPLPVAPLELPASAATRL